MRFLEETRVENTKEEWICGTCGETNPVGTTMVLEKYISRGKLVEGQYCDTKKCNPINDWEYKRNVAMVLGSLLFMLIVGLIF